MEEPLLRIGEIAAFFRVSVKAIRLYEKKGIIIPAKVDAVTGYRYYTPDQVQQLGALLELKAVGFSLGEIKDILAGEMGGEQFVAALLRKRMAWQDAVAVAENKMDTIDKMVGRISESNEGARLHEMTEDQRARLLAKMVCVEGVWAPPELSEALWL